MKKRGFTLVELLVVIAIISILATIGVTAVIKVYNNSVKKTMIVQENNVAEASKSYLEDYCIDPLDNTYKCPSSYENNSEIRYICLSDLQDNEKGNYVSKVNYKNEDCKGIITFSKNDDGEYIKAKTYLYCDYDSKDKKYNYVTDESLDTSRYSRCNISSGTTEEPAKPVDTACTFNGELKQGAEFVSGQYTYRYKQRKTDSSWNNISNDGWGVTLTNKNSTDAVTTKLCNSINGKPIVSMSYMFEKSNAVTIDTSSFDTSNVTDMSKMFFLADAKELDLSNFGTSNVTNMNSMFAYSKATTINGLNKFNTNKVTNMGYMFSWSSVNTIDLSSFNTSNVTTMENMFETSNATTIIGLNKLNTSKVVNMYGMFWNTKVTTLDLSSFSTSNVTDMRFMFNGSEAATIKGLKKFNTSKVTNMSGMFGATQLSTLDLSNFNTSNVTNMSEMFYNNKKLTTIYVSNNFVTSKVTNSTNMFKDSTKLVGGFGTIYSSSKIDKTYARIDGGTSNPGYFTSKNSSTNAGKYIRNLSPKGLETTAHDGLYRFVGTSNNYINIGGISYRIIGITDNSTINTSLGLKENQLKLIKATPVGTHAWSSSRTNDYPFGNSSNDLYTYLNNTVINNTSVIPSSFKNSISSVKWYNGDASYGISASAIASYEMKSITSKTAKLGLMYLSDYFYSSTYGGTTNCYNTTCNSSWIYNSSYNQWTMTRNGRTNNTGYIAGSIDTSGKTNNTMVVYSLYYSPVFYLNENMVISSGNGSFTTPFIINIK